MKIQTIVYDFFIIRTVSRSDSLNIYIAKNLKTQDSDEQYVINEITDQHIIKKYLPEFTQYENSANRISAFFDLFTLDSSMYIVFKYLKESPLLNYLKNNVFHYTERIGLLKQILFELSSFGDIPLVVLNSIIDLENINIDKNNNIYFNFFINNSLLHSKPQKSELFNEISLLIDYLFKKELSNQKHKLHIVSEKARKNIYRSIPELIKDIEHLGADQNILGKIKMWVQQKKALLSKLGTSSIVLLMLFGCYYLYDMYTSSKNIETMASKANVDKIGTINYTASPENIEIKGQGGQPDTIYISAENYKVKEQPEANIETPAPQKPIEAFENYVVKTGDNLIHICKRYYGNRNYWKALGNYNNIKNYNLIIPGQIVKLPSKEFLSGLK